MNNQGEGSETAREIGRGGPEGVSESAREIKAGDSSLQERESAISSN